MDRTLENLIQVSARNLLFTSALLEPYVPQSQHNTYYSLALLGSLAEITRQNLLMKKDMDSLPTKDSSPAEKNPSPTKTKDAALLQALMELRKSGKLFKRSPILRHEPSPP